MADQEYEELRRHIEETDEGTQEVKMAARNYKLVHAITPLEENKSFLEKVQLGGLLCGLGEHSTASTFPTFISERLFLEGSSPEGLNALEMPPPNIWSSDVDDSDDDSSSSDDLEAVSRVIARRPPAIRWQDVEEGVKFGRSEGNMAKPAPPPPPSSSSKTAPRAGVLKTTRISNVNDCGSNGFMTNGYRPCPDHHHRLANSAVPDMSALGLTAGAIASAPIISTTPVNCLPQVLVNGEESFAPLNHCVGTVGTVGTVATVGTDGNATFQQLQFGHTGPTNSALFNDGAPTFYPMGDPSRVPNQVLFQPGICNSANEPSNFSGRDPATLNANSISNNALDASRPKHPVVPQRDNQAEARVEARKVDSSAVKKEDNDDEEEENNLQRRRKLPELPKDRKPLQKIRQASLLEELREACQAKYKEKKSDANKEEGGNNAKLLTCIAESQDPPELPPSFILNLVKIRAFLATLYVLGNSGSLFNAFLATPSGANDGEAKNRKAKGKVTAARRQPQLHTLTRRGGGKKSADHEENGAEVSIADVDEGDDDDDDDGGKTKKTCDLSPGILLPDKLELLDPTHRGLHRFVPRHRDELEIDIGDPVYVQREAEDLWCEGANLRTGKIGIFPLAHVVDVDYNDFDPRTNEDRKERYLLEYIGSVESNLYKGNSVLYQAVKKILGAKEAPKRHSCVLEISSKGIKMIDKSKMNFSHRPSQDYFYSLKNVTFCGYHPSSNQYFGFVTKHPKLPRYACHVFLGEGSTQHVAEACGRAFHRFYQKFIETAYPVEDIYLE